MSSVGLSTDEAVPALDVGASVALTVPDELRTWAADSGDIERFEIAAGMIDDFEAIDDLTGWSRLSTAGLLGCHAPEPRQWLDVAVGELAHSQTVVHFIRTLLREVTESADTSTVEARLVEAAPSLSPDDVRALARREIARSVTRLTTDLLRRARGSTFAVERVLADGQLLACIVADDPGTARLLGYERLQERARVTAALGRVGTDAFASIGRMAGEPTEPGRGEVSTAAEFPESQA